MHGGGEIELAIHRAAGDVGNPGAKTVNLAPRQRGDFIEHFVFDHGRFHVCQQQALAAVLARLGDQVDRCAAQRGSRGAVGGGRQDAGESEGAGNPRRQPVWPADPGAGRGERVADEGDLAFDNRRTADIADQGQNVFHACL